jgi:hypothetical protein
MRQNYPEATTIRYRLFLQDTIKAVEYLQKFEGDVKQ